MAISGVGVRELPEAHTFDFIRKGKAWGGGGGGGGEEFNHSIDLKRHARLAVAWSRHGSLIPRWT